MIAKSHVDLNRHTKRFQPPGRLGYAIIPPTRANLGQLVCIFEQLHSLVGFEATATTGMLSYVISVVWPVAPYSAQPLVFPRVCGMILYLGHRENRKMIESRQSPTFILTSKIHLGNNATFIYTVTARITKG
jgi:hypothetical protein